MIFFMPPKNQEGLILTYSHHGKQTFSNKRPPFDGKVSSLLRLRRSSGCAFGDLQQVNHEEKHLHLHGVRVQNFMMFHDFLFNITIHHNFLSIFVVSFYSKTRARFSIFGQIANLKGG